MNELKPSWRQVARLTAVMAVMFLAACSDAGIKAAKQEPYPGHSGTTFEKVLDNYEWCKSKKWRTDELKTGEKYVEFTCIATEPDVRSKIAEYLAKLDEQKAKDIAKLRADEQEALTRVRQSAYIKQRSAASTLETHEDRLQNLNAGTPLFGDGMSSRNSIVSDIEWSRAELASYQTPEYVAAAESAFQKDKKSIDADVAERLKELDEESARQREVLTDGTIKVLFQWQLTQSGSVGRYGMGVDFDFGDRKYSVDGQDGIANNMLATVYANKPILNGLRGILIRDAILDAPDGMLLYYLSRRSLKAKGRS